MTHFRILSKLFDLVEYQVDWILGVVGHSAKRLISVLNHLRGDTTINVAEVVENLVDSTGKGVTATIAKGRKVGTVDCLNNLLDKRGFDALYFSEDSYGLLVFFA